MTEYNLFQDFTYKAEDRIQNYPCFFITKTSWTTSLKPAVSIFQMHFYATLSVVLYTYTCIVFNL